MKTMFIAVATYIVAIAFLFALFCFYHVTADIKQWSSDARFLFVYLAFFLAIGAIGTVVYKKT